MLQNFEKARELVLKYGQNSISYLALESDKQLFFGSEIEGVIAYGIVGHVVTVCGDPICAPEDFAKLLQEFQNFYQKQNCQSVFLSTTVTFIDMYEAMGYRYIKEGEEAIFDLDEYKLSGGKMQKLRALINHANNAGLTTHEYKPNEERNLKIEKAINDVSNEWLKDKKSGELGFTIGGVNLESPLDRRYFYATDEENKIVAFNVFLPFIKKDGKGYMADVTRRLHDAPSGATEKINFDTFMIFREEGAKWGSLGMSPLANLHKEHEKDTASIKLLEFVYEHGNRFYGFKALHHAKEKYTPTEWSPAYIVYSAKHLNPELAYAIVKIQNPGGITDFLMNSIKSHFHH